MGLNAHGSGEWIITPLEKEVLEFLKSGLTARAIADRLGISEGRVKFHTGNILKKMQVRNRLEAVIQALEQGLIT